VLVTIARHAMQCAAVMEMGPKAFSGRGHPDKKKNKNKMSSDRSVPDLKILKFTQAIFSSTDDYIG